MYLFEGIQVKSKITKFPRCKKVYKVMNIWQSVTDDKQMKIVLMTTRKPSCRWQTRVTRKHAKKIRHAYIVVDDNTGHQ